MQVQRSATKRAPNLASRLVLFLAHDTSIYRSGHTYLENASWTVTYPKIESKLPAVVEIRRWECNGMVLAIYFEPAFSTTKRPARPLTALSTTRRRVEHGRVEAPEVALRQPCQQRRPIHFRTALDARQVVVGSPGARRVRGRGSARARAAHGSSERGI